MLEKLHLAGLVGLDRAVRVCVGGWLRAASCLLLARVFTVTTNPACVGTLPLQAALLAVSRARPPLSACGRVWALSQGPLGRLEVGSWAGQHHMAAAAKERAYWSRVSEALTPAEQNRAEVIQGLNKHTAAVTVWSAGGGGNMPH
jgi:hypothetical protein